MERLIKDLELNNETLLTIGASAEPHIIDMIKKQVRINILTIESLNNKIENKVKEDEDNYSSCPICGVCGGDATICYGC